MKLEGFINSIKSVVPRTGGEERLFCDMKEKEMKNKRPRCLCFKLTFRYQLRRILANGRARLTEVLSTRQKQLNNLYIYILGRSTRLVQRPGEPTVRWTPYPANRRQTVASV